VGKHDEEGDGSAIAPAAVSNNQAESQQKQAMVSGQRYREQSQKEEATYQIVQEYS
jgi:hypothetical protein